MTIRSKIAAFLKNGRPGIDWNQNADFFRYTRGHFIRKPVEQAAQRHVKFDMNELCKVAENVTGRSCVDVEKFADGLFNKAFLMTMDDGEQVVAKVPNPNAGRAHYTTASEVATMDLMRNVMATPAPQVLTWDSSNRNAVQAEYIIMKKAKGVQLATVWPKLEIEQRGSVIKSIAKYQMAWSDVSFGGIGSLYYKKDLPVVDQSSPVCSRKSGKPVDCSKFVLGPIVSREWSDHGKMMMDCDRGPWTTAETYRRATIERDMQALRTIKDLPTPLSMLCGPSLYQPTKEKKLFACETAMKVLPQILPREDWAQSFHIWHDDLHGENIFVDADDPTVITAIIDWQSTCIVPLFDHIMFPGYLDHDGPPVRGMERPSFPELSNVTDPNEEAVTYRTYEERMLAAGYKAMLRINMKPALEALLYDESEESAVLHSSRNLFELGEAYCLGSISKLNDSPVQLSEAQQAAIEEDVEKTAASLNAMNVIKAALGDLYPEKGIVAPELYEASKAALQEVKEQVLGDFSKSENDRRIWEQTWPFQ